MKSFKGHIIERAQQIRYSGILDARSHQQAEQIVSELAEQNKAHKLGAGYFSVVFGGEGQLVIKLSDSAVDGVYHYLALAKQIWMRNPHVPRVAALQPFRVGSGYVAIMEVLDFSRENNERVWRVDEWATGEPNRIDPGHWRDLMFNMSEWFEEQDYVDTNNPPNETYERFKVIFPRMHELFEMMHEDEKIAMDMLDIHGGNVANRRGQTPVLVDPIGGSYGNPYNPEFQGGVQYDD